MACIHCPVRTRCLWEWCFVARWTISCVMPVSCSMRSSRRRISVLFWGSVCWSSTLVSTDVVFFCRFVIAVQEHGQDFVLEPLHPTFISLQYLLFISGLTSFSAIVFLIANNSSFLYLVSGTTSLLLSINIHSLWLTSSYACRILFVCWFTTFHYS